MLKGLRQYLIVVIGGNPCLFSTGEAAARVATRRVKAAERDFIV
jgi:hypothetical protein